MAVSFKIAKGKLPEWHWLYKRDSTDLVDPFFHVSSLSNSTGVSTTDKYTPEMVVGDVMSYYNNYWKFSDEYKVSGMPGLVYTGTTPGLGAANASIVLTSVCALTADQSAADMTANQYKITREYLSSSGGYCLKVTNEKSGSSNTYLTGTCPTCLYFEMVGGGGGGSSLLAASGMRNLGGNGGAGGGFIAGVLDFSKAPDGFVVYVGAGGKGGTYINDFTYSESYLRSSCLGSKGKASFIINKKAADSTSSLYHGVGATGGNGGTTWRWLANAEYPDWAYVEEAPSGGFGARKDYEGNYTAISAPFEVQGIHVLYAKNGAHGGVHISAWANNPIQYPPVTSCSSGTLAFVPGHSSKTFNSMSGGTTWSATTNEAVTHAGGGASQIGSGTDSPLTSVGPGAGGAGGVSDSGYNNGQAGGNGKFILYSCYTPDNTSGSTPGTGGVLPGGPGNDGAEEEIK